jgi:hypothetical protein
MSGVYMNDIGGGEIILMNLERLGKKFFVREE